MATNLRLRPELEDALRLEAERSHRSQQDVIRAAIASYLKLGSEESELEAARRAYRQKLMPPRTPFRRSADLPTLSEGETTIDLLRREDRI